MFVGLCAGDGDKYFFRLGRVETSNEQQLSTIIISTSTTENPSINHHHHLISTIHYQKPTVISLLHQIYFNISCDLRVVACGDYGS